MNLVIRTKVFFIPNRRILNLIGKFSTSYAYEPVIIINICTLGFDSEKNTRVLESLRQKRKECLSDTATGSMELVSAVLLRTLLSEKISGYITI